MSRERKRVQRLVNGLFWFVLHMVIKTDNEPGLFNKDPLLNVTGNLKTEKNCISCIMISAKTPE